MSDKLRKIGIKNIEYVPEMVSNKNKKQKHNSKRRKSKKNEMVLDLDEDFKTSKVDEVVKYLCNTISKNESDTSIETNPPLKIAKESENNVGTRTHDQNSKLDSTNHLPSTSASDLSNLFENLQVHTSSNQILSNNLTEFLNIDLLKKTNCETLNIEDLEKLKQEKLMKVSNKNDDKNYVMNGTLDEYFNLNLIRSFPERSVIGQIDSSSMRLVSKLEQTFCSSLSETEDNPKRNKQLTEYFNVDALAKPDENLVESIKSKSKLLVNELEKTLLKGESSEKNKKLRKKKKKKKDLVNESCGEVELTDENQKVAPQSEFHQRKDSCEQRKSSPQAAARNRKRQHSLKNSTDKTDTKFPKYLSEEELQSVSNFGVLLSGIIRINQKNYKEAYISAPDKGMDILIEGLRDRNRALEGDEVYFVLKPKEHYRTSADNTDVQRTAVVVGIKTLNHNRGAIGTLNVIKNKNVNFALFSPRDSRLPRIRIKKTNWPPGFCENSESFKDRLYFAKISQWADLRFADGEILKELGHVGDIAAETEALLLKYELDTTPYSEELKKFIPPPTFRISELELSRRQDLRSECVFTIDPATAVDLDDAVSCKRLPNGNYQVGVHISDVSYFLTEGTPLDTAVCKRATTVYLVQKAYHMLPFELCRLCSLTPGEDKLSFSVFWEISPDSRILGHRFARTVINSCAQFSYEQVQSIIDGSETVFPKIYGPHSPDNIKDIVLFLHKTATKLRSGRFKNGALRIDQNKIHFSLDENRLPVDFLVEVHEESHRLIEEFMLLANITVAEKLNDSFPKIAFLRSHSPPHSFVLEKLQKSLEKYGIILDISSSGSLYESLLKYSGDDTESIARMLVLNNTIAKPMVRAKYYCSSVYPNEADRRHYALNVPLYTHFTSPIRRYADVMTHRLLSASTGYTDPPHWNVDYVQSVANNCNKQKYAAKMAGETSTELFLSVYVGLKGPIICEAVVCDIKDKSFDCIGLSTGAHQRLYFEHIKGEFQREKEDGILRLTIKWPNDENHDTETIQIIEMFSIVQIELKRVNVLKIEASLLRCE